MNPINLETYLNNGVEQIIKDILKASLKNPKTSMFMMNYVKSSKKSKALRNAHANNEEHIPPFLIASITNKCNLHCNGCYARANNSCTDNFSDSQMTGKQWGNVFKQASELGIGFILLAGGEPMMRPDVLLEAGKAKNILFPIFTNGTMIANDCLKILESNRNLIPVISIEGNMTYTDERRGSGVYHKLIDTMSVLSSKGVLFGVSITVTKSNVEEVMSETFANALYNKGCKGIVYVEYVPVGENDLLQAPDDTTRTYMAQRLQLLRTGNTPMLMISFPGDEKSSGGCLAAGRGFFHINAHGGVEPCPFSPYSDTNITNTTLLEALHSPLFTKLHSQGILSKERIGGCVLFEQEDLVKNLV